MEAAIRVAFPDAEVQLIPGGGGDFIVHQDGKKIWDKNADQSGFPDETSLVTSLHPAG